MESNWQSTNMGEAFQINPTRNVAYGTRSAFVPMDALSENRRTIARIDEREFTGSGMKFQDGDTLVARITPCLENGKTAYVSGLPHGAIAHGSTEYIVITGKPGVSDDLFAYYLARSNAFRTYAISQMEGTSGRQRVSSEAIKRYEVELPPLHIQRSIAQILGELDDKIELNRQLNQTLEQMAQALFQSWFVDFEPVKAKRAAVAEGRDPLRAAMSSLSGKTDTELDALPREQGDALAATAALFPEEMEPSALGDVPKGWAIKGVSDEFQLTMGQSPPGDTYNEIEEGLSFYQGRADFSFRFPRRRVFCTAPTRFAKAGDSLVSVRAPVGDVNMASEECAIGRGVAAVRHSSGSASFTYYTMKGLESQFSRFEGEGTVFGSINKNQFAALPFVAPSVEVTRAFDQLAGPLDTQISVLSQEIQTLSTLRDALLPKLLSGELTVGAAEAPPPQ